jgi:Mn-dependent DtxR family transcriptional regulator
MKTIGEVLKEKNIELETMDPVLRGGFTQVPNFILRYPKLSMGAKVTYALFLSYAWNDDFTFRGQDRLAADMGMSRSRVSTFTSELVKSGLMSIKRRGLGKTNIYSLFFQIRDAKPNIQALKANQNICLVTDNAAVRGGFTQIPNFILRDPELSLGAKVAYALFLCYAWHNDFSFAGQDRMAEDMGMSRPRATVFVGQLQSAGLISIQRRGLGQTNDYKIFFQVRRQRKNQDVSLQTSRSLPANIRTVAHEHPQVCPQTSGSSPAAMLTSID